MSRKWMAGMLVFLLVTCWGSSALAHRMIVDYEKEGLIKVRFDDRTAAVAANVEIYDADDNLLKEGQTDGEGYFSFDPSLSLHRAVADDGAGHQAEYVMGQKESFLMGLPAWLRGLAGITIFLLLAAFVYRIKQNRSATCTDTDTGTD